MGFGQYDGTLDEAEFAGCRALLPGARSRDGLKILCKVVRDRWSMPATTSCIRESVSASSSAKEPSRHPALQRSGEIFPNASERQRPFLPGP
jgi:hypothetical protein